MKKFAFNAVAIAAGALAASGALAGSITAPASDAAATPYAVEALVAGTDISLPSITYTMGVSRTTAQDFTIIYKPVNGTFTSCPAGASFVVAGGGAAGTVSNKRSSATECAYEVDVTTAFTTATTLTIAGFTLDTHTLNVSGNTASVAVGLWDLGETARIDNTGDLTRRVAISGNALTLTAAADTATVADVNNTNGPLFGFLANGTVPADTTAVAAANFVIGNNSGATAFKLPDGITNWDFTVNGTSIAVTVAGSFQGMATGGFAATTGVGVAPTVTATAAGATATYTLLPTNIGAVTTNTTVTNSFTSAQTASLGTSRTFGVSAVGDVVTGADVALSGSTGWWTWSANASQLMSPYFSTNPQYVTRFSILNTGSSPVGYTARCFTEGAPASVAGTPGTLKADGTTIIDATAVCSFTNPPRGAILFTINAPINSVKGAYNIVDKVSGSNGFVPLTRPYNNSTTE